MILKFIGSNLLFHYLKFAEILIKMVILASSVLFNIGVVIFALAIFNLFFVKYIKVAIINMLVANVFFALAMAYAKKLVLFLGEDSFILSMLRPSFAFALLVGACIYLVLFLLLFKFFAIKDKAKVKAQTQAEKEQDTKVEKADPSIFANVKKEKSVDN